MAVFDGPGTHHEGIRRMRFEDVLGRSERSELSQIEPSELLGITERTLRRWRGGSVRPAVGAVAAPSAGG